MSNSKRNDSRLSIKYNRFLRSKFIGRNVHRQRDADRIVDLFDIFGIDAFYKFKSLNSEYTLKGLRDDTFHFSLIGELNDPQEFSFYYNDLLWFIPNVKDSLLKKIRVYIYYCLGASPEEVDGPYQTLFEKIKEYTLVHSLTTTYSSGPMWAHYANEENGICLEYDAKEVLAKYGYHLVPVEYKDDVPTIPFGIIYDFAKLAHNGTFKDDRDINKLVAKITKFLYRICSVKNKAWIYEKEWRIVVVQYREECSVRNDVLRPKGVIIGRKVPDDTREEILEICKEKGIKPYEITNDVTTYELVKTPI